MAKRSTTELAFSAIRIEGGLLAADFLGRVARFEVTGQAEADYDIPKGLKLRDEIGRYWKIALNLWQDFQAGRQRTDHDAHSFTSKDFLEPFCRHVLGFTDIQAIGQVTLAERIFPIGYQAVSGQVPLVFAAHTLGMEQSDARFGDGHRRRSPFLLAQEYLNAEDLCLWAIVSNGLKLRILRDNPSLTRPAYIEVDLEAIFNEERYPDFTAFWLLAHATRFGSHQAASSRNPADCHLERWRNTSQESGIRARERLRDGVGEALRALGTGFVSHPKNTALREQLDSGALSAQAYYEQLLRLIYRFIFLATLEDRQDEQRGTPLVFAPNADEGTQELYLRGYSLNRLREHAAKRRHYDRYSDLWQGLGIAFAGLAKGQPALGLPALGGLFTAEQCPHLDGAQLENRYLLQAVFGLCFFREGAVLTRVNYRDMGSEELGSVYESLLELVPVVSVSAGVRKFVFVGDEEAASTKGNARKLSGSYYTPDSLVQELIKSALEPVIAQTLQANLQQPVKALLGLTVCDPACGSGHFLLAAARRIAEEVARLNASEGNPLQSDYRHALREVVAHCIYGVDKNPMAVELAKTALWLEAYTPDRPLTFLDHHLRCGDALLGVLDPVILEKGIPSVAFNALSGDDKAVVKALKKANSDALKAIEKSKASTHFMHSLDLEVTAETRSLEALPDDTLDAIAAKRAAFAQVEAHAAQSRARIAADLFVAAFVLLKTSANHNLVPTSQDLWLVMNASAPRPGVQAAATQAAHVAQAFHWHLVFPQIFSDGQGANNGFDVLLGNPPWERIKLQEEEFFATRSPLVAESQHKAERGQRIELLKQGMLLHALYPEVEAAQGLMPPNQAEQQLYAEFLSARRSAEASSLYAHDSGRYPLTGVGDVNTYALFAETFAQLMSEHGRAGFIVPAGIATDDSTKAYFEDISQHGKLATLLAFENEEFIFPAIHHSTRFCILTLGRVEKAEFVFFARKPSQVHDPRRRFTLTPDEFRLINPNTRTCPVFRSNKDAELTKKLYRAAPVLIEEGKVDINPWHIRFMAMIHMSSDSELFYNEAGTNSLPLYEAKMIHQFDHRWATYQSLPSSAKGSGEVDSRDCTDAEKADPHFVPTPRYWVDAREVYLRTADLPKGLLTALRERNNSLIVLGLAHLLFGNWLQNASGGSVVHAIENIYTSWQDFVVHQPFARHIAPTQMGLTGDNPACLKPLGQCYLPAQPLDDIENNDRSSTAWYTADEGAVATYLHMAARYTRIVEAAPRLTDEAEALEFAETCLEQAAPRWMMGWRDITSAHVLRTVIASVVPRFGIGHTMPLFFTTQEADATAALLGNLSAVVLDYIARLKVGGTHLTYGYLKQFPILPPNRYIEADLAYIVPRVLELTYTTHDLKPWAEDLGYDGQPFPWDPDRRAVLRAELDAYYAKLYSLTRDELRYILDPADVMGDDYPSETFRVLKNSEMRQFGEYRTARLVLREFDRMALADAAHEPYLSLLVPPPGQPSPPQYSPIGIIRDEDDARLAGLVLAIIRQAGALSHQSLTLALTAAHTSGTTTVPLEQAELDQLAAYRQSHQAMLLPARLERTQLMLRFFEDAEAIRIEQQGAWIAAAADVPLPAGVTVEQDTEEIAGILLRTARANFERQAADDLDTASQASSKQA